mmetsp:Transcript_40758/g.106110  ORF Transcript_40758/g.106110 Transcript_40758/m.106110 type:complete len:309 (+) Transcript_40758:1121-2047(+)
MFAYVLVAADKLHGLAPASLDGGVPRLRGEAHLVVEARATLAVGASVLGVGPAAAGGGLLQAHDFLLGLVLGQRLDLLAVLGRYVGLGLVDGHGGLVDGHGHDLGALDDGARHELEGASVAVLAAELWEDQHVTVPPFPGVLAARGVARAEGAPLAPDAVDGHRLGGGFAVPAVLAGAATRACRARHARDAPRAALAHGASGPLYALFARVAFLALNALRQRHRDHRRVAPQQRGLVLPSRPVVLRPVVPAQAVDVHRPLQPVQAAIGVHEHGLPAGVGVPRADRVEPVDGGVAGAVHGDVCSMLGSA